MGETSTDTKREIEDLRAETTTLIVSIEGRVRHALDLRAQIREHPGIAAGVGIGLSAGLGLVTFAVYRRVQERRSARWKAQQRLRWAAEHFAEGLPFRPGGPDGRFDLGNMRVEKEPNLAQRLAWTMLATGGSALASYLARQLTDSLWQKGFGEPPPEG